MSGFLQRWGAYLALVIVFAIACGLLSWWQWSRRAEAVAEIALVEANYDASPAPLGELLPARETVDESAEWHPVILTGEYLADEQLVVRNRPYEGSAGFDILVPLRLADGSVFIVDRGWVPAGARPEAPQSVPPPPAGEVTVVVRLRPGEPELAGRTARDGQVATINLATVAEIVGLPTYTGMYGQLVSETPSVHPMPSPALRPDADEGPHLSYALQWITFGILAFVGLAWAARRERRIASGEHPQMRPGKRPSDADIEDEILNRS